MEDHRRPLSLHTSPSHILSSLSTRNSHPFLFNLFLGYMSFVRKVVLSLSLSLSHSQESHEMLPFTVTLLESQIVDDFVSILQSSPSFII